MVCCGHMVKHKHIFQYADRMVTTPSMRETAVFICECGLRKIVEIKEVNKKR